eukprot:1612673-Pyramimonas_sp.AAC.2
MQSWGPRASPLIIRCTDGMDRSRGQVRLSSGYRRPLGTWYRAQERRVTGRTEPVRRLGGL